MSYQPPASIMIVVVGAPGRAPESQKQYRENGGRPSEAVQNLFMERAFSAALKAPKSN